MRRALSLSTWSKNDVIVTKPPALTLCQITADPFDNASLDHELNSYALLRGGTQCPSGFYRH